MTRFWCISPHTQWQQEYLSHPHDPNRKNGLNGTLGYLNSLICLNLYLFFLHQIHCQLLSTRWNYWKGLNDASSEVLKFNEKHESCQNNGNVIWHKRHQDFGCSTDISLGVFWESKKQMNKRIKDWPKGFICVYSADAVPVSCCIGNYMWVWPFTCGRFFGCLVACRPLPQDRLHSSLLVNASVSPQTVSGGWAVCLWMNRLDCVWKCSPHNSSAMRCGMLPPFHKILRVFTKYCQDKLRIWTVKSSKTLFWKAREILLMCVQLHLGPSYSEWRNCC